MTQLVSATVFTFPWPPSVNTYYRAIRRGKYASNILSKAGREYPKRCRAAIGFYPSEPIDGRIALTITLYPPDRRRRDLDNYLKPILDALTKCRIWLDDSQVDELVVKRGHPASGGRVVVELEVIE